MATPSLQCLPAPTICGALNQAGTDGPVSPQAANNQSTNRSSAPSPATVMLVAWHCLVHGCLISGHQPRPPQDVAEDNHTNQSMITCDRAKQTWDRYLKGATDSSLCIVSVHTVRHTQPCLGHSFSWDGSPLPRERLSGVRWPVQGWTPHSMRNTA